MIDLQMILRTLRRLPFLRRWIGMPGFVRNISLRQGGVAWNHVSVDPSGLLQVHGTSALGSSLLPIPRLTIHGQAQAFCNKWRYAHPNMQGAGVLAGFCYEWILPPGRVGSVTIDIPQAPSVRFDCDLIVTKPHYSVLFDTPEVRTPIQIYGSGLPSMLVPAPVRDLFPLMTGRVLDFGCGAGALVRELRSLGIEASGVEIDRPLIRDHLLPEAAPFLTIYAGGPLPFPDNSFDCVVALEVLEHIEDYTAALREIRRVAPRLILSVPDIATIPLLHQHNVVPWHLLESTHINFFNETSLRRTLEQHYRVIDIGRMTPAQTNSSSYFLSLLAICEQPLTAST